MPGQKRDHALLQGVTLLLLGPHALSLLVITLLCFWLWTPLELWTLKMPKSGNPGNEMIFMVYKHKSIPYFLMPPFFCICFFLVFVTPCKGKLAPAPDAPVLLGLWKGKRLDQEPEQPPSLELGREWLNAPCAEWPELLVAGLGLVTSHVPFHPGDLLIPSSIPHTGSLLSPCKYPLKEYFPIFVSMYSMFLKFLEVFFSSGNKAGERFRKHISWKPYLMNPISF